MADYGVTNEGFVLKRLNDILMDLTTALSGVVDPVTGQTLTPDLADEDDPLVQLVNAFADDLSVAWEHLQLAYNQFDPLKATGAGLSGTVQLNKLRRKAGTNSTVNVALTGSPALAMPAGKLLSNLNGDVVFELPAITFDGSGDATAVATCTEQGPIAAEIGTLVNIVTPTSGWDSVTNTSAAALGTYEESDSSLRNRQQLSTSNTGSAVIESFYAGLINLEGVTFARAYQNITNITDARGIPAKTVSVVVVGGDNNDIAELIFQRSGLGLGTYGSTTVNITDSQFFVYPISFSRPAIIPVYVEVDITITNTDLYPTGGSDVIKAAIIAFATQGASGLGLPTSFDQDGYTPGQPVYASELYTPVNSLLGIKITGIRTDIVTPAVTDTVAIDWDELASFDIANITVTET